MNILHIVPDVSPTRGGSLFTTLGLARAQVSLGHDVHIVATDYGYKELARANHLSIDLFPCRLDDWRWSPEMVRGLPGLLRDREIVHIHTVWEFPVLAGARACRKAGKPYIIKPGGMLDATCLANNAWKKKPYMYLLLKKVFRDASAFHFTSEMEKRDVLSQGLNPAGFIVPLGIDLSVWEQLPSREAFREKFPELAGRIVVLFLGRLDKVKQPEVIIRAFDDICGKDNNYVLVLAGPGETQYVSSLKDLVYRLGLSKKVVFTGLLRADAVREAYCTAEIFILPSLHENFGLSVAEAMAAGCPVIISDRVHIFPAILKAGAGLVGPPTVEAFSGMLKKLISDEALRKRMGENGRALVFREYTWEKVAGDMTAVYEDILSGSRNSPAWNGCV